MTLIENNFFVTYNVKGYYSEIAFSSAHQCDLKILSAWYFGMWHFKMATIGFASYGCVFLSCVAIFSPLQWSYAKVYSAFRIIMCIVYTNNTLNTTAACDKSDIVDNVYVDSVCRVI